MPSESKSPTDNPGRCSFCDEIFTRQGMTRHLNACDMRQQQINDEPPQDNIYHMVIEAKDRPEYWIHLENSGSAPLSSLDKFLRMFWLECCGHLSELSLNSKRFQFQSTGLFTDGWDELETDDVPIGAFMQPETSYDYEYDLGTPTRLKMEMKGIREGDLGTEDHRLLARNLPPEKLCTECGEPAEVLCRECLMGRSSDAALCTSCLRDHEHWGRGPGFAKVVNSPRSGVCGYELYTAASAEENGA